MLRKTLSLQTYSQYFTLQCRILTKAAFFEITNTLNIFFVLLTC